MKDAEHRTVDVDYWLVKERDDDEKEFLVAATAFGFKQMIYEPFLGGGLVTAMSPFLIDELGPWPAVGISAV